jgi:MFS transporter, DHA1 family, multidrug resistance protein
VSGWIANSNTISFRWADYISLIISGAVVLITIFFLPETFAPILLKWKATHLRRVTGNPNYISKLEIQPTFLTRLQAAFNRAAHMFTREPIIILLGVWLVLVYIIVYGFVQSFSFVFGLTYGWNKGLVGSAFAAICVGVFIWYASAPFYWYYYKRKVASIRPTLTEKEKDAHVAGIDLPPPEYRLWTAAPVAPGLPISLFWLAWTNYASVSPWSSLCAMGMFGICWAGIYVTVYNYILDVYGIYAGSALAIITFFRYTASAGISMVSRPMYLNIHVHWSMTLFGCVAVVLAPVPLVLAWYGPKLRERSRFASQYAKEARERIYGKE